MMFVKFVENRRVPLNGWQHGLNPWVVERLGVRFVHSPPIKGEDMKVIINRCFGGFGLSDKAVERCIELGMTVSDGEEKDAEFFHDPGSPFGSHYYALNGYSKKFRINPIVIKVVEELSEEANGPHAKLKIIEIPFDSVDGWEISEYDGIESIEEDHQSWS
jgi:hypothetical protein